MEPDLILPKVMTPAIEKVLGRQHFACHDLAMILRHAGHDIPHRAEAEQAAVLWFLLPLAIRHGDEYLTHAFAYLRRYLPTVSKCFVGASEPGPGP